MGEDDESDKRVTREPTIIGGGATNESGTPVGLPRPVGGKMLLVLLLGVGGGLAYLKRDRIEAELFPTPTVETIPPPRTVSPTPSIDDHPIELAPGVSVTVIHKDAGPIDAGHDAGHDAGAKDAGAKNDAGPHPK